MTKNEQSSAPVITSSEIRFRNFITQYERWQDEHPEFAGHGVLKKFSEALGISERQVGHLKSRRRAIGAQTARKIEQALGLPAGFMDVQHLPHGGPVFGSRTLAFTEDHTENASRDSLTDASERDLAALVIAALRINRSLTEQGIHRLYRDALKTIRLEGSDQPE